MAQVQKAVVLTEMSISALSQASLYFEKLGKSMSSPCFQLGFPLTNSLPTDPQPVEITYITLDSPRIVSFAGFGYDVNSGYLTLSSSEHLEPMGILNLNEHFENITQGRFNSSLFLFNLEKYKLGEIENPADIFELDGAGKITLGTGSLSKRYLESVMTKNAPTTVGNNFYKEFKDFYREYFTNIRKLSRLLDKSVQLQSDTGYLFSTFDSGIRQRFSEIADVANSGFDNVFLPTTGMNSVSRKELSAKSTLKYLGMRELLRISNSDEDDKVMHSLLSTDDEIKKAVKASPYKDVIKGAALSGLIKKKDQVVEGINKSWVGPYLASAADIVTKYTSYIKTVFTKVKI